MVMIISQCNLQRNKYDSQTTMYANNCTHYRLRSSDGNKIPAFPDLYVATDRIWRYMLCQAAWKIWFVAFDSCDLNTIILYITYHSSRMQILHRLSSPLLCGDRQLLTSNLCNCETRRDIPNVSLGPLLLTWTRNYIYYKMWDEIA